MHTRQAKVKKSTDKYRESYTDWIKINIRDVYMGIMKIKSISV